jgi:hypothetical protein
MADDTSQTGTDTIATDDLATLNGSASSGVKIQRVKPGFGDDGDARDVSRAFPLPVIPVATTPTVTGVTASASSTTLLSANTSRRGATLYNSSTSATAYIRFGAAAASIASGGYSVEMPAGAYLEVPFGYTGEIRGIWAAATGYINVTEIV